MSAAALHACKPSREHLLEIRAEAERAGLILVTNGRDLAYTLPHCIPEGWTRYALVHPGSERLDPREPQALNRGKA